jgi:copper homeostasis protein
MIVEAVACSVDDALIAQRCGADRIELCSAIEIGGLTPSVGLVREVLKHCSLPVVVMVRPRPGGFVYGAQELGTMRNDIEALVAVGVEGIVTGVLKDDLSIDVGACERLLAEVPLAKVFHRAFDLSPDTPASLDDVILAGFTRVLTSGRASSALEGATRIKELIRLAAGRIEILAGGGIRPDNVGDVCRFSGVSQIHLGPFCSAGANFLPQFGRQSRLDEGALKAVVQAARTALY